LKRAITIAKRKPLASSIPSYTVPTSGSLLRGRRRAAVRRAWLESEY
jgi:hypothetical protein